MNIDTINNRTLNVITLNIAQAVKARRLELNLTQKAFSKRAGVGYDAYRKFENTGEITLQNLVLCAIALDDTEGFLNLFTRKSYENMDELLKIKDRKNRKRGSKNE